MNKSIYAIVIVTVCIILYFIYYIYSKIINLSTQISDLNTKIDLNASLDASQVGKLQNLITTAANNSTSATSTQITLPVGIILSHAGNQLPVDFLECNGVQLLISDYPSLFNIIGSTYNQIDTDTSLYFNLPDLRNQFVRGADTTINRSIGTLQSYSTGLPKQPFIVSNAPGHAHVVDVTNYNVTRAFNVDEATQSNLYSSLVTDTDTNTIRSGVHGHATVFVDNHTHDITGGDNETRPTNIALYYIIKVR